MQRQTQLQAFFGSKKRPTFNTNRFIIENGNSNIKIVFAISLFVQVILDDAYGLESTNDGSNASAVGNNDQNVTVELSRHKEIPNQNDQEGDCSPKQNVDEINVREGKLLDMFEINADSYIHNYNNNSIYQGMVNNEKKDHKEKTVMKKQFMCNTPRCHKKFSSRAYLELHEKTHGEDDEKVFCKVCKKQFCSRGSLKIHMQVHENSGSYLCWHCDKAFTYQHNLEAHQRTHLNLPRPFECKICKKTFVKQENLDSHSRLHTNNRPYICFHFPCDKRYTLKSSLVKHMLTHEERKHICDFPNCGKKFVQNCDLKVHKRIHSAEKPFRCPRCDRSFTQKQNMAKHILLHK